MDTSIQLSIPAHFNAAKVGEVWRVPYQSRAIEAKIWSQEQQISPAAQDETRVCLLAIDVQNTFCIPEFELFVGGRSGKGAVEDSARLCEFIYRNLGVITEIVLTMDTHTAAQIFHPVFWVNAAGEHPSPMTMISRADVEQGIWSANPRVNLGQTMGYEGDRLQAHALHYVRQLDAAGKFPLTIWPYHSMLGGVGHAIVSSVEEACFFHSMARDSQTRFEMKGGNPLTENYSVLKPEVLEDEAKEAIAHKNTALIQTLLNFDVVLIAGQAKSHCVAWTIDDLLTEIQAIDPILAQKIYLLEDCSSPVVVPGVVDFTDQADQTYQRFADAGMQVIKSTDWAIAQH